VPPSEAPSVHVNLIVEASVTVASFAKLIGASGTSYVKAPLPASEKSESPYELVATTFTSIGSFLTKE